MYLALVSKESISPYYEKVIFINRICLFRAFTYDSILQRKTLSDVTQTKSKLLLTVHWCKLFTDHPKLKKYQPDVEQLYRKHKFHYVWYDHNG
jgi:hypothetical protein